MTPVLNSYWWFKWIYTGVEW